METASFKESQSRCNIALSKLRKVRLAQGLPFMINAIDLPSNQCYLEFANGDILLVGINSSSDRDFTIIRELNTVEKDSVRKKFQLL